jgi:RNA polymerase sigma-70 factor (ECF subfamily)
MMVLQDDNQLLLSLRNGEEKAFEQLFLRYYPALCVYAKQFVGDEDSKEVVQNLMVWLWENREMVVVESSLRSYLFSAVRNSCLTELKKKEIRRKAHHHIHQKLQHLFENPDFYVADELAKRIEEAVAALPESYRTAFVKNRFEQKTYNEIAKELGVSAKTIDYRITQALKLLRISLKDYLPLIGWLL